MLRNFVSAFVEKPVSESWVTWFLHRHRDKLTTLWLTSMAAERHKADYKDKYKLYFNMLDTKMNQYGIEPEHIYNMDRS